MVRGLTTRGAVTTAGNAWSTTQLRRSVQNPRYSGLRVHRGEVVGTGNWPAVFDEGTRAALLAVFADPSRRSAGPPRRYLLSGVATCGVCDGKVFGVGDKFKGPLYRCETRLDINRQAGPIEAFVGDGVVARLQRPDALELVSPPRDPGEVAALHARAEVLRQRLDDVALAFASGDIDGRQLTPAEM